MAAVDYSGFRWNQSQKFYNPYVGKGAVLFTGIYKVVPCTKNFKPKKLLVTIDFWPSYLHYLKSTT